MGVRYRLNLRAAVRLWIHSQYYPHHMMLINKVPKLTGTNLKIMILLAFLYRQKVVSSGDLSNDFTNSFYRSCLQIFHHCPQLAMSAEISSSSSLSSSICINLRHFYNSKTNTNICVQHIFMKI